MGINILVDTKYIHLLVCWLAPIVFTGRLVDGTYKITSVASHSTVRVYDAGGEIFVSSTREDPGPFELWNIKSAQDGGYTFNNVGLTNTLKLDTFIAAKPQDEEPQDGEPCVTNRVATVFNIESAGENTYVIKLPYADLLWNVEPHVVRRRRNIKLRPANGSVTKKFTFTACE